MLPASLALLLTPFVMAAWMAILERSSRSDGEKLAGVVRLQGPLFLLSMFSMAWLAQLEFLDSLPVRPIVPGGRWLLGSLLVALLAGTSAGLLTLLANVADARWRHTNASRAHALKQAASSFLLMLVMVPVLTLSAGGRHNPLVAWGLPESLQTFITYGTLGLVVLFAWRIGKRRANLEPLEEPELLSRLQRIGERLNQPVLGIDRYRTQGAGILQVGFMDRRVWITDEALEHCGGPTVEVLAACSMAAARGRLWGPAKLFVALFGAMFAVGLLAIGLFIFVESAREYAGLLGSLLPLVILALFLLVGHRLSPEPGWHRQACEVAEVGPEAYYLAFARVNLASLNLRPGKEVQSSGLLAGNLTKIGVAVGLTPERCQELWTQVLAEFEARVR